MIVGMLSRLYDHLQQTVLVFLVECILAPSFKMMTAMRYLKTFFKQDTPFKPFKMPFLDPDTAPQITSATP